MGKQNVSRKILKTLLKQSPLKAFLIMLDLLIDENYSYEQLENFRNSTYMLLSPFMTT